MSIFGGGSAATGETKLGNLKIQQTGYNVTIAVVMGTNSVPPTLAYYSDFIATPHENTGGGKGLGGGSSGKSYTYTASIMLLVSEGDNGISFGKLWVNKTRHNSPADAGFITKSGADAQTPWSYLVSKHPDDALVFNRFAYIAAANYPLTNSASIGNHSVEVLGYYRDPIDAQVKDCMRGVLLNTQWGCGWDTEKVDALDQMDSYCQAYGIAISPALTEQKAASEVLAQFAKIANSAIVWSDGKLKCIPYAAQNHGSYVATASTGIHLTNADFIVEGDEEPVRISRKLKADSFNEITIEYLSRAHNYDVRPAKAHDQGDIEQFKLRPASSVTMHEICLAGVANTVAQNELQRSLYIGIEYEFNLSWPYCLLEPMDVVHITEVSCGLDDIPVRIIKIKDRADGLRIITAEEMPWGAGHVEEAGFADTEGYVPMTNVSVGPVNTPVIFVAPAALAAGSYEVWVAISNPDSHYGGCVVHTSFDDETYTRRGTFYGNSIHGVLTADLVAGDDPDINPAHQLAVDLTVSGGTLSSTAAMDSQLCLAGDEFIAYRFATLTGLNQYDLFSPVSPATTPYLRRGLYGSTQGATDGARFAVCDNHLFRQKITADDVGKTMYFKFQSFNAFNDGLEDLAYIAAYHITITEPLSMGTVFDQWA
jgi:hypothetical protein